MRWNYWGTWQQGYETKRAIILAEVRLRQSKIDNLQREIDELMKEIR